MRVVAIIAVRNEERVLGRTLEHLFQQGVETCLLDDGSMDASLEIAEAFREKGVFRIERLQHPGDFNMPKLMAFKEQLAQEIKADWFLHQDADEIREAPRPFANLPEGLAEMDRQGFNAVEFQEFVFLPTTDDASFEGQDFVAKMRHYYYFLPQPYHRLNAWKKTGASVDLHTHWGHRVEFAGRRVAPVPFVLRHYMALSRAHALGKYGGRIHSAPDIKHRGWSDARVSFQPKKLQLPTADQLKTVDEAGNWDVSDPWPAHRFIGASPIKARSAEATGSGIPPATEEGRAEAKSWLPTWLSSWRPKSPPESATPRTRAARPPMPIIVGAARSGTTLLRMMLDSHPQLAVPPETHFLPALRALQRRPDLKGEAQSQALHEEFLKVVTRSLNWKEFGIDEADLRAATDGAHAFGVSKGCRRIYQIYAEARHKTRWGDKTPPYVMHMRDIHALLPEARFVHIIRDGRDVALSIRGLWFDAAAGSIADQAANWLWRMREARQQAAFCPHYLEVRYEQLLADPPEVLRRICEFVELEYSPEMERYHESAGNRLQTEIQDRHDAAGQVVVSKAQREKIFERVGTPPDLTRVGRWRQEMSQDERASFQAVAGEMLRELGYEVD